MIFCWAALPGAESAVSWDWSAASCCWSAAWRPDALDSSVLSFCWAVATALAWVVTSKAAVCCAAFTESCALLTEIWALLRAAWSWAKVAAVGEESAASRSFAELRFISATLSASVWVWLCSLARTWPAVTRWPTETSISDTMPLFWKSTESCVAGLTLPVALTLDSTTPRCTVAVVVGAFADAGGPTATYAAVPRPAMATTRMTWNNRRDPNMCGSLRRGGRRGAAPRPEGAAVGQQHLAGLVGGAALVDRRAGRPRRGCAGADRHAVVGHAADERTQRLRPLLLGLDERRRDLPLARVVGGHHLRVVLVEPAQEEAGPVTAAAEEEATTATTKATPTARPAGPASPVVGCDRGTRPLGRGRPGRPGR